MPTANPAAIQFGSYQFPDTFILTEDDVQWQDDEVSVPFQPGMQFPNPKVQGRTATVAGALGASPWGGCYSYSQSMALATAGDVQTEIDNMMGALQAVAISGPQQLLVPAGDRFYYASPDKPTRAWSEGMGYRYVDMSIPFKCPDPRAWAITQQSSVTASLSNNSQHTLSITNGGNTRAYPLIVLTANSGSGVGFKGITVGVNDGSGHAQIIPGGGLTISNSGWLAIWGDPLQLSTYGGIVLPCRSVTDNTGANQLANCTFSNTTGTNVEFFPYLNPGANTITVQAAAAPGGGSIGYTMTVYWQNLWI